jgi:hypothetical protein
MSQEISRPNPQAVAARQRDAESIEDSIRALKERTNIFARWGAHLKSGKNAATVLVAMQKDVAEAQREIVQHHANLIARARKMDLTDRFQAAIGDLTRRVEQRTGEETKYYWEQLTKRLDYYEEFFESRIREIEAKVAAGQMSETRGRMRIEQYEESREEQQKQDTILLKQLMDSTALVVRRALEDFQPS